LGLTFTSLPVWAILLCAMLPMWIILSLFVALFTLLFAHISF
jgi:hypothetical protein